MEHLKKINMKKEYNFRDPVVKNVVDKFVSRSDVGFENMDQHQTTNVDLK